MFYDLVKTLFYIIFKLFFKFKIKGGDLLPKKGPFIVACNHLSHLDPPVVAAAYLYRLNFLAKEELFRNELFGFIISNLNVFSLDRSTTDIKSIRIALEILKHKPLVIFPQGTRGGSFDNVSAGIGFLYRKSKVPIIAAKIKGTDKILPKGAKFLHSGKIEISFAKVDNIEEGDDRKEIASKVMDIIRKL